MEFSGPRSHGLNAFNSVRTKRATSARVLPAKAVADKGCGFLMGVSLSIHCAPELGGLNTLLAKLAGCPRYLVAFVPFRHLRPFSLQPPFAVS